MSCADASPSSFFYVLRDMVSDTSAGNANVSAATIDACGAVPSHVETTLSGFEATGPTGPVNVSDIRTNRQSSNRSASF